jgi:hypothetical protein
MCDVRQKIPFVLSLKRKGVCRGIVSTEYNAIFIGTEPQTFCARLMQAKDSWPKLLLSIFTY